MRHLAPALFCLALAAPAVARDFAVYPVGRPDAGHGVKVAVSYFQPIDLEGALMQPSDHADIHLETDVTAIADDQDGYAEGDWRPYMNVTYRLTRSDTGQSVTGALMPLVAYGSASIGKPHYGDNLKLFGPGRYRLELNVAPPPGQIGVGKGLEAFTLDYSFVYAGIGKKGAY